MHRSTILVHPTASSFTLGLTTQGANSSPGQPGIASSQAILSKSATVISMSVLIGFPISTNVLLGIYSDVSGTPTNLLATTPVIPVTTTSAAVWFTANVTGSPVLNPGTYWLTLLPQNTSTPGYYASAGTAVWDTAFAYQSTLPATYPTVNGGGAFTTSLYATLFG